MNYMPGKPLVMIVFFVFIILLSQPEHAPAGETIVATHLQLSEGETRIFIKEMKKAWKAFAKNAEYCEGTSVTTMSWIHPSKLTGQSPRTIAYSFKRSGECSLQHKLGVSENSEESVRCVNHEYAFILRRSSSKMPWVIGYVGKEKADIMDQLDADGHVLPKYWLYLEGKYLPDLLASDICHITHISKESNEALVDFVVNKDVTHGNQPWWVKSGSIRVETGHSYRISELALQCEQRGKAHTVNVVNEYLNSIQKYPRLQKSLRTTSGGSAEVCEFNGLAFKKVDIKEFTLEAYGLEWGSLGGEKRTPLLLWINIGVIITLVGILVIRVMKR